MTKKHYEHAAIVVKAMKNQHDKMIAACAFAALFKPYNPRFDENRFFVACGFEGVPEKFPRK